MREVVFVRSLQRRVALVSVTVVTVALAMGIVGMELVEGYEHEQMLDGRLQHLASTILRFVDDKPGKTQAQTSESPLQQNPDATEKSIYTYQIWLTNGKLLFESPQATLSKPLTDLRKFGFDSLSVNGEMNRVFSLLSPGGSVVVQVAEPIKERGDDFRVTFGLFLVTLLIPFGFSMAATWFLLRSSFRTLDGLAKRLHQHDLLDAKPMTNDMPAKEFAPVWEAVNSLIQRTGQAFLMEQRFTSTAAHELRTPWAGIRAQAQMASHARNPEELQAALQAIIRGVDRASHLFEQLFDLTRIDSMCKGLASSFQRVQLATVYIDVLDDLRSKAESKGISLTQHIPEESIQGLEFAIFLLLRNLISNAILYAPQGGRVEVNVERHGQDVILTVDDSGKGIPVEAREHAFERFNRLGQQGSEGVGLGLSIVAQIVELHDADIQLLDSPLGGLRVQVVFKDGVHGS